VHLGCWGDGDFTPPTVKLLWLEYACRSSGARSSNAITS
jgi:hypothetical protein